jgi:hypothetical protein
MEKQNEWHKQQFENSNWWYNPIVLSHMTQLMGEKYMQQFLIINQFAQNPERDRVIYKLFSTESTVSWDEVWYLIRDFSTGFFLTRFEKQAQTDERKSVRKYFQLFVAKLKMKQGNYTEAKKILDDIIYKQDVDEEYEKLFIARSLQAEAECAKDAKDDNAYNDWVYRLYTTYPQLLPYTGLQMNMRLHIAGQADDKVVSRLKDCNINWVTNNSTPAADVYVTFTKNGDRKGITYYVQDKKGKNIVDSQSFSYQKPEEAALMLAYRIFNVDGKTPAQQKELKKNPA